MNHAGVRGATDFFNSLLDSQNWILCGNALQYDWLSICPPTGKGVKHHANDLFHTPLDQAQIDFENEGGETYICGNPPYQGSVNQQEDQKTDIGRIFNKITKSYKDLDYVSAWFIKSAQYLTQINGRAGLVATNSICQGEQVSMLWPYIFSLEIEIVFAHTSFPWSNNAANNAGVTCVIVGIGKGGEKNIYTDGIKRRVASISPYLIEGAETVVTKRSDPLSSLPRMVTGNLPSDGGNLLMTYSEGTQFALDHPEAKKFLKRFVGSKELINGGDRWCLWIEDDHLNDAININNIANRVDRVKAVRENSRGDQAKGGILSPHKFVYITHRTGNAIAVPKVSSSRREYIPWGLTNNDTIVSDLARVVYDAPLWSAAIICSKMHLVWIATVCGKLKTDFRYSNTLGWNTFPVPILTEKNKTDLTRCAEDILLVREAHFPATIADLYDPKIMPIDLRAAHDRNDEVLERIYIGRRFKNDTERLEKLFDMYVKMSQPRRGRGPQ